MISLFYLYISSRLQLNDWNSFGTDEVDLQKMTNSTSKEGCPDKNGQAKAEHEPERDLIKLKRKIGLLEGTAITIGAIVGSGG